MMRRMLRFLLLAFLVLLLGLGLAPFAVGALGLAPSAAPLAWAGVAAGRLPGALQVGAWALDALALLVLVLLFRGRGGGWFFEGLAAGLLAWVFRGPLTLLSVVALAHLPREPWGQQARIALVLYPLLALAASALAARMLPREPR